MMMHECIHITVRTIVFYIVLCNLMRFCVFTALQN